MQEFNPSINELSQGGEHCRNDTERTEDGTLEVDKRSKQTVAETGVVCFKILRELMHCDSIKLSRQIDRV